MGNAKLIYPRRGSFTLAAQRAGVTRQAMHAAYHGESPDAILAVWQASRDIGAQRAKKIKQAAKCAAQKV